MAFFIGFKKWFAIGTGSVALSLSFAFSVIAQTAPTFSSPPVETGTYGSAYNYSVTTDDIDGNTRSISISAGSLPTGLVFTDHNDGTASISGVPGVTGSFPLQLTVTETNGVGLTGTQQVNLEIAKASLTITAEGQAKIYGQVNPALTISYIGFVNGDDAGDITVPAISTTATDASEVNAYPISLLGGSATNYNITLVNGTLTINPALLTLTAEDKTKTYGTVNPALTISYSGFVNGDDAGDISVPIISTTATDASGVNTYPISLTGGSAANYTVTLVNGTLTVTPGALTLTAENKTKTYGTINPTLTISYSGFVNGDDAGDISVPIISTTATDASGVNTYPISLTGGSAANYTVTLVNGTLTVNPAVLTLTAENKTKTYGAVNPALTISYSGFVNGDDAGDISVPTISTTATDASGVNTYPISLTGGSAANYTMTLVNGTLTVNPAVLTLTADDKTKTYGAVNPALTISYSGFVNGDDAGDISVPTIGTTATNASGVNTYPISLTGGSATNYTIALVNGTLTVNPAVLTLTAEDKTKTYGAVNPALTISYNGFVNGDDAGDINGPIISTTATDASGVNIYPITLLGGSALNYSLSLVNGSLTVTPAALIATASDKTKVYGEANPALTISYSGFVNGEGPSAIDEPSVSTGASVSSNVGSYPIVLSGGNASNYILTRVNGSLSITKAVVTATADNKTKVNGQANPPLTITYSGFVNGDAPGTLDVPPAATTTAPTVAPPQNYPITVSGGTDNNYSFNYVPGTLTVTNASPTTSGLADVNVAEDANNSTRNLYAAFSDLEDSDANLTYTVLANTNPGLFESVSITPGLLTLDFKLNQFGSADITIRTTDTGGLHVDETFTVNVAPIQDMPVFTSVAVQGAVQGQLYQYSITATDADPGDILTISGLIIPSWATLIDYGNGTALLSGVPNSTNVGTTGNGVALRVSDDKGEKSDDIFPITVVNTNDVPDFTSTAGTSATQNVAYVYSITALDDDAGDALTITAPVKPSWLTLTDNGNRTATLTGIPANAHVGSNVVQLKVSDGFSAFSVQNFTINVANVNDPPYFISAPVTTAVQDQAYAYQIQTGDPDIGDHVSVISLAKPSWLTFTDNGNGTASLAGNPGNQHVGTHAVSIQITDASNQSIKQDFNVVVSNTNDAPSFFTSPATTVNEDVAYTYSIEARDIDAGDVLVFSAAGLPAWLSFVDQGNGKAVLSGTPLNQHVGSSSIILKVRDVAGSEASQAFTLTVINTNDAPVFTSIPITLTPEDALYEYHISFSDPDVGDAVTLSVSALPAWLTFSPGLSGVAALRGTPKNEDVGSMSITVTVKDASGVTSSQFFQLLVSNVNDSPVFLSSPILKVGIGQEYVYNINTSDPDTGDIVTLSTVLLPSYLSFTNSGNGKGKLAGTITSLVSTAGTVTLRATDKAGVFTDQTFHFIINTPPVLKNFKVDVTEDIPFDLSYSVFTQNFTDPGDAITSVRVKTLPSKGKLFWNSQPVTVGTDIVVTGGAWNGFNYLPDLDFNGSDAFQWNASDGTSLAANDATIALQVRSANDPPVVGNVGTQVVSYSLGDAGIEVFKGVTISDVDNSYLRSATLVIHENYTAGDALELPKEITTGVKATFNSQKGELVLLGRETKSNYESLIGRIVFSSPVTSTNTLGSKKINLMVNDSIDNSNVVSKMVQITEIFPELSIVNSFTPNQDGVNDVWDILNLQFYQNIAISIFDKNNNKVFNCTEQSCAWDGKSNGQDLPPGPYFYAIDLNNGKRRYQGTVTILR